MKTLLLNHYEYIVDGTFLSNGDGKIMLRQFKL